MGQNPDANARIENTFTYHAPDVTKERNGYNQLERYQILREHAKALAYKIEELVKDSREKALAMTYLEIAVMEANAGIARNE